MGKRSYKELLKESIVQEFDTTKTVDVKGPMLDNILSYTGDGELPTHQDAASILERYYYGEGVDKGVSVMEAPQNEIPEVPDDNINSAKNDMEDEIEPSKTVGDSKAVKIDAEPKDIEESIIEEDLENAVLERLISELEEQEEPEKDEDEEMEEKPEKSAKELDVDKELSETSSGGALPGFKTSTGKKLGTGAAYTGDELEEAFQLFQEQVEDEDEEEEPEEEMEESLMVREQDEDEKEEDEKE